MSLRFILVLLILLCGQVNATTYQMQLVSDGVVGYSIKDLSFTSNKTSHLLAEEVTFNWSVDGNPETISISGYGKVTGKSGTVTFAPGSATSVTLTAVANGISQTKSIAMMVENAAINNVCRITFTNMSRYSFYGSALSSISIVDGNNNNIPFGLLSYSSSTKAIFTNATVTSSSTWNNGNAYYVAYAIAGYEGSTDYWLGDGSSDYSIRFNQPQSVKGIRLSDTAYARRGETGDYTVIISNCSDNVIKRISTHNVSSGVPYLLGYIDITK